MIHLIHRNVENEVFYLHHCTFARNSIIISIHALITFHHGNTHIYLIRDKETTIFDHKMQYTINMIVSVSLYQFTETLLISEVTIKVVPNNPKASPSPFEEFLLFW